MHGFHVYTKLRNMQGKKNPKNQKNPTSHSQFCFLPSWSHSGPCTLASPWQVLLQPLAVGIVSVASWVLSPCPWPCAHFLLSCLGSHVLSAPEPGSRDCRFPVPALLPLHTGPHRGSSLLNLLSHPGLVSAAISPPLSCPWHHRGPCGHAPHEAPSLLLPPPPSP